MVHQFEYYVKIQLFVVLRTISPIPNGNQVCSGATLISETKIDKLGPILNVFIKIRKA